MPEDVRAIEEDDLPWTTTEYGSSIWNASMFMELAHAKLWTAIETQSPVERLKKLKDAQLVVERIGKYISKAVETLTEETTPKTEDAREEVA